MDTLIYYINIRTFILIFFYALLPSLKRIDNIFKSEFIEGK